MLPADDAPFVSTLFSSSSKAARTGETLLDPIATEIVERLLAGERLIHDYVRSAGVDRGGRYCLVGALSLMLGVLALRPLGVDISTALQSLSLIPGVMLAGYGVMRLSTPTHRFVRKTLLPLLACELLRLVPNHKQLETAHAHVRRSGAKVGRLTTARDLKRVLDETEQSLCA